MAEKKKIVTKEEVRGLITKNPEVMQQIKKDSTTAAVMQLLIDKGIITEDEIKAKIKEIQEVAIESYVKVTMDMLNLEDGSVEEEKKEN